MQNRRSGRLAVDGDRLLERAVLVDHAEDAPVLLVAPRIADVVLHVADDDVVPVGKATRGLWFRSADSGSSEGSEAKSCWLCYPRHPTPLAALD